MGAEFVLVVITAGDRPDDSWIACHFGEPSRRVDGHAAHSSENAATGATSTFVAGTAVGMNGRPLHYRLVA
jgi:hypothetical protein